MDDVRADGRFEVILRRRDPAHRDLRADAHSRGPAAEADVATPKAARVMLASLRG